ncbi:MAG TPA: phosphopantetheine-binding protein [Streptosporangiaceae bacterium]
MTTVYERLSDLLVTKFGVSATEIEPDATFEELELDSLALVEVAMAVQEEFGVDIGDSELTPKHTMTSAVEVLTANGVSV